jgi:hypothetical protein
MAIPTMTTIAISRRKMKKSFTPKRFSIALPFVRVPG